MVLGVLQETLGYCASDTARGDVEENILVDCALLDGSLDLWNVEQRDQI